MAYSQYSRPPTAVQTDDEHEVTNTTAHGSTTGSSWQQLLASNTRKRAMGRTKGLALPQRMGSKGTPEKANLPLPQRVVTARKSPPQVTALPQRLTPQRSRARQFSNDDNLQTPEMPRLKTVNFRPRRSPERLASPKVTVQPPEKRSQSTPPVLKRPPKVVEDASRPTMVVNHKSYYVMERIGKGGSSEVFSVLEAKGNRIRAVKKVDLSDITNAEREAFLNEVKLLAKLQKSRRVVQLIDYEERSETQELFVVMEHGERDLANLLKELSTSEDEDSALTDAATKYYWENMLQAVSVVHSANVVHSDLKPANFLIVKGQIKLIDFGIASSVSDNKTHVTKNNLMGTFNFMSPEAISDLRTDSNSPTVKIGFKSDVWSLGCILYNMVYKRLPFAALKNPVMKLQAIINPEHEIEFPSDPESLHNHDVQVVDVLQKCLQRDPFKRASIEDLLDHPYLKPENMKKSATVPKSGPKHLDSLLSSISCLTPNSRRLVMENLTNTKN